ncbi:hypothetical protein GQ44DRAFT_733432 [Phaeosphaeriaceae sp. PMI808]|nr:hypothetical protein GQ44DRAFT_733432 [Phaeosphaeriaceae sp. PMI808]
MTLISSSSKLTDISRLFREVCKSLKDVGTTTAAILLKPLQNKAVFPIIDGSGSPEYGTLLNMNDKSWYIVDRPTFRDSFQGKLPLLALPSKDLPALDDLFRILRLEGRKVSSLVTSRTEAKGQVKINWDYTGSLRSKSPFIKALIPYSHADEATLKRQINEVRVYIATDISQTLTMNLAGSEIHGAPIPSQVTLTTTDDKLTLSMTEECATAECPPHELVSLSADTFGIKDSTHYSLLFTALSNSSMKSISSAFSKQGIQVEGLPVETLMDMKGTTQGLSEGIKYSHFQRGGSANRSQRGGGTNSNVADRRLPMLQRIQGSVPVIQTNHSGRLVPRIHDLDGWQEIQYLGENRSYLGKAYDPERDWTSELRSGFGYTAFTHETPCAPFTLRDPTVAGRMADFIVKYGRSKTPKWPDKLRKNATVYHLDLAVSTGDKRSSFVGTTAQIERMRKFRMDTRSSKPNTDVVILVRVNKVYSEVLFSVDFLVDPWRLFDANLLSFGRDWIITGTLNEGDSSQPAQRRKVSAASLSRLLPASIGANGNRHNMILHGGGKRVSYQYKVLLPGHVRLLYPLPGEEEDRFHAMIIHVHQSYAGTYQALSYVWGTASTCAFLDGGKEGDAAMEMLLQVSSKASLDEKSNHETNDQYLTKAKHGIDAVGESTPHGNEKSFNVNTNSDEWPKSLPKIPTSWKGGSIPPLDDPIWGSVKALFGLPWFGRVWIIQEIVAAPNVKIVCGKWVVDWNDLHLAVETLERKVQVTGEDFSLLKQSWEPFLYLAEQREWEARQCRWSLFMLLEHFRHAQSTLSRDRLFALVGLASDGNEAEFEPDYDSAFERVVLKYAQVFVRQSRGIQLLYRAGLCDQSDRFPSWIPDRTTKRAVGLHDSTDTGVIFLASGPQKANIECIPDTDELSVTGYEFDTIKSISKTLNVEAD